MSRMAVLVLDMLNDFVTGTLKTKCAARIVKPIKKVVVSGCGTVSDKRSYDSGS